MFDSQNRFKPEFRALALRQGPFLARPQKTEDNEADYQAVMANRPYLKRWSDSNWPEDHFSPEDNLADLQMHIAENTSGEALGFSLFYHEEFLGSLYVNPFEQSIRVDYWLREDLPSLPEKGQLHRRVIEFFLQNFPRAMEIEIHWGTREGMEWERELLKDLGLIKER